MRYNITSEYLLHDTYNALPLSNFRKSHTETFQARDNEPPRCSLRVYLWQATQKDGGHRIATPWG